MFSKAFAYGFLYAITSAGEIVAIKSLNYNEVPLLLPAYTALLSNQVWPLASAYTLRLNGR